MDILIVEDEIVFITSFADADTLERAWRTRPADVLGKIGDHRELCRVVVELMDSQGMHPRK